MDKKLTAALNKVIYPGFNKSLTELGMVTAAAFAETGQALISLKPIMAEPEVLESLEKAIRTEVSKVTDSSVEVIFGNVKKEAPADGSGRSVFKRARIPQVRVVAPIVSGKGGVGKSTVTCNLAKALARSGKKVGILDLDIFGPSIHKMFGVADKRLEVKDEKIIPIEAGGIKIISIGMAMSEDEALVIRGPMVMKLLDQLLNQTRWGELDYLLVDMPPGTGDVPLSLVQQLHVTGAIVVTTPQEIALIDARRAIAMFRQTETKLLGLIENMSYFECSSCSSKSFIFGEDGAAREAKKFETELLGSIPIELSLRVAGDEGKDPFETDRSSSAARAFEEIALKIDRIATGIEEELEREEKEKTAAPYKNIPKT